MSLKISFIPGYVSEGYIRTLTRTYRLRLNGIHVLYTLRAFSQFLLCKINSSDTYSLQFISIMDFNERLYHKFIKCYDKKSFKMVCVYENTILLKKIR